MNRCIFICKNIITTFQGQDPSSTMTEHEAPSSSPIRVSVRMKAAWSSTAHTPPTVLYPPHIYPFLPSCPESLDWVHSSENCCSVTAPYTTADTQEGLQSLLSKAIANVATKNTRIIIFLPLLTGPFTKITLLVSISIK